MYIILKRVIFLLFSLGISILGLTQTDSLVLSNHDVMIGEIKGMDRGVVTIETKYSKEDFKVKWGEIKNISTTTSFMITLKNGDRLNGRIRTVDSSSLLIQLDDQSKKMIQYDELVYLKPFKTGFIDRLHAAIDFGFSLTKAQNFKQVTLRSNIGYVAKNWSADVTYNTLFSNQDKTTSIKRTDGGLTFNYLLPKDWYIPASITFLSNTEQQLDLRMLEKLGVGNYLHHSNHSYWGVAGGFTYNSERYANTAPRKTWEAYLGTELNLYDIGDLSLLTKLALYPSITESGRWRYDFNFDTKYDLPLNLYIKLGITYNYDNRPVAGASNSDYVMQTGIGWKL